MKLREFMEREGISDLAALDFSSCRVTLPRLLDAHPALKPKTALLYLVPYYAGKTENLSVYAAARDYHLFFKDFSARLIAALEEAFPGSVSVAFSDHSPIDERDAAARAGLGIIGRNGLLITPRYASFVFIGEVITDVPAENFSCFVSPTPPKYCEDCGACRRACPTGILRGEGNDCLSEITQRKGELSDADFDLMVKHRTVWGCDLCQLACPHAIRAIREGSAETPVPFFRESLTPRLTYRMIEEMPTEEFSARAYAWRGRKTLLRNLAEYEKRGCLISTRPKKPLE